MSYRYRRQRFWRQIHFWFCSCYELLQPPLRIAVGEMHVKPFSGHLLLQTSLYWWSNPLRINVIRLRIACEGEFGANLQHVLPLLLFQMVLGLIKEEKLLRPNYPNLNNMATEAS